MKYTALINVMKREFGRIAGNKAYYLLSIFLPLILFAFLSVIYLNGVVRDIPVEVLDEDHSALSASYIRLIESTGALRIVKYAASQDEMKKDILDGKIYGCFCIPKNMESELKKGKPATVTVFNNTTNLITGNTLLKEATTITKTFSGGVLLKKLRSKGLMEEQVMDIINTVRVETQSLYNSNYNYLNYLVPGLIPATLQMIIMLIAVLVFSSEFAHGTFAELMHTANDNIFILTAGKSIPHILLHIATALGIIGILYPCFNVTIEGSVLITILFFVLFILASFFSGMAVSVFTKNTFFATEVALFINTPAFIFSGFVFPLSAMPQVHSAYAQIMPFTHFMNGFLKVAVMKTPLSDAGEEFTGLLFFVLLSLITVISVLWLRKKRLKMNDELILSEP